jgi:membrane protease YdiL (CAAX protease family)
MWMMMNISPGLGETLGLASGTDPDFVASSVVMLKQFSAQYGVVLLLVLFLSLLAGGRSLRSFSLSQNGHSLKTLMLVGLVAGFMISIPVQVMFVARELWSIGEGTIFWVIADRVPWDWSFWLFFAIGSFVVVPVIEELTWRGYALGRLKESFGPGAALAITTLIFTSLHTQYFMEPDLAKTMAVFSLILATLVFGFLTLSYGSVLPAIIAHAVLNTPASLEFGVAKILIGIGLVIVFRAQVFDAVKRISRWLWNKDVVISVGLLCVVGGLFWYVSNFEEYKSIAMVAGVGGLAICSLVSRLKRG